MINSSNTEWTFFKGDTVDLDMVIRAGKMPWPLNDAQLTFGAKLDKGNPHYVIGPILLTITSPLEGKVRLSLDSTQTNMVANLQAEIEYYNTVTHKRKTIWQGSLVFQETIID